MDQFAEHHLSSAGQLKSVPGRQRSRNSGWRRRWPQLPFSGTSAEAHCNASHINFSVSIGPQPESHQVSPAALANHRHFHCRLNGGASTKPSPMRLILNAGNDKIGQRQFASLIFLNRNRPLE